MPVRKHKIFFASDTIELSREFVFDSTSTAALILISGVGIGFSGSYPLKPCFDLLEMQKRNQQKETKLCS